MRAVLLEVNSYVSLHFKAACYGVGLRYDCVASLPALLRAAKGTGRYDIVALDSGYEGVQDADRCLTVLEEVCRPVFVLYRQESFAQLVRTATGHSARWLATGMDWLDLLDRLDDAQWESYAARLGRMPHGLSETQRAVLARLGAGKSRLAIADELGLRIGTLKTHLSRLQDKYDADTMEELQAVARLALREGEPVRPWRATVATAMVGASAQGRAR